LCCGLFHGKDQVGLACVITDSATYAYLCDVYVLEAHSGKGLAKWLMQCVMALPAWPGLRRFSLATRDAHGLYRQFPFRELSKPESRMEILRPQPIPQSSALRRFLKSRQAGDGT